MSLAEQTHSDDIDRNSTTILATIENVIQCHNASSGASKGRAFPATAFHHSHV